MLILGWLLGTSLEWRGATVTIKMMVPTDQAAEGAYNNLDRILQASRTGARTEVIVAEGRTFWEVLRESSSSADLVFLGMAEPRDEYADYYAGLQNQTSGLPSTVYVLAAEELEFGDVIL